MTTTVTLAKRVLVGAPMRSENLGETLLPKRVALPIFSSDALSSVAYATEAILKVLTVGGWPTSISPRGSPWRSPS